MTKRTRFWFAFVVLVMTSTAAWAQVRTFNPTRFTARDEVTVTFNLAGTPLAGYASNDLVVWAWSNLGDAASNGGGWGDNNIQPPARLTRVQGDIWTWTFVPADLYGYPAAEMRWINFLVRTSTGGPNTPDLGQVELLPLPYEPPTIRVVPGSFRSTDPVTVFFDYARYRQLFPNANLSQNVVEDLFIYSACQFETWNGTQWVRSDDWQQFNNGVRIAPEWQDWTGRTTGVLRMNKNGDIFSFTFIPNQFFGMAANQRVVKVNLIIRNAAGNGQTGNVEIRTLDN